ncbi:helix-turn-helix domain-containing protein [Candidatus Margulisiibacteriota bacterium]
MSTDRYNNFSYDEKNISQLITRLREAKGLSKYQLGLKSGLDSSVIRRIETGERKPYVETLLKIIDGLGMSPDGFFNLLK